MGVGPTPKRRRPFADQGKPDRLTPNWIATRPLLISWWSGVIGITWIREERLVLHADNMGL